MASELLHLLENFYRCITDVAFKDQIANLFQNHEYKTFFQELFANFGLFNPHQQYFELNYGVNYIIRYSPQSAAVIKTLVFCATIQFGDLTRL